MNLKSKNGEKPFQDSSLVIFHLYYNFSILVSDVLVVSYNMLTSEGFNTPHPFDDFYFLFHHQSLSSRTLRSHF